jgi:hypothetical protein
LGPEPDHHQTLDKCFFPYLEYAKPTLETILGAKTECDVVLDSLRPKCPKIMNLPGK